MAGWGDMIIRFAHPKGAVLKDINLKILFHKNGGLPPDFFLRSEHAVSPVLIIPPDT